MQELNSTMYVTRMEGEEVLESEVGSVESLDGLSANETVKLLILAEVQRLVRAGGLLMPVLGAVRWGFENVPRNFATTFVRYWGDPFSSETAPLEIAYACARLSREDEGLRIACSNLDFPQVFVSFHSVSWCFLGMFLEFCEVLVILLVFFSSSLMHAETRAGACGLGEAVTRGGCAGRP
jgi:hypothetical protein